MNEIVGIRIREYRKQKGLTQEEVAEHLRISQPTYARIENGQSNSWPCYLARLCTLFNLSAEKLFKDQQFVKSDIPNNKDSFANKLIQQLEARIEEKERIIRSLKKQIKKLN